MSKSVRRKRLKYKYWCKRHPQKAQVHFDKAFETYRVGYKKLLENCFASAPTVLAPFSFPMKAIIAEVKLK